MKITKAIIPAAGLGTRFLPITKAIPKPMLPIVDKPTIQYIIEEVADAGITDAMIIVSPGTEDIIKHFSTNHVLEERLEKDGKVELLNIARGTNANVNITFATQMQANGLADAILQAETWLEGQPFALLLGDELLLTQAGKTPCIKQLVDNFEKTGNSTVGALKVAVEEVSKYGNLGIKEIEGNRLAVNKVVEKPKMQERLSDYAIIGRYALSNEVLEVLKTATPENGEVYLTDAFNYLASKNQLDGYIFEADRFDAGDKLGYIQANIGCALRDDRLRDAVLEYIKECLKEYQK